MCHSSWAGFHAPISALTTGQQQQQPDADGRQQLPMQADPWLTVCLVDIAPGRRQGGQQDCSEAAWSTRRQGAGAWGIEHQGSEGGIVGMMGVCLCGAPPAKHSRAMMAQPHGTLAWRMQCVVVGLCIHSYSPCQALCGVCDTLQLPTGSRCAWHRWLKKPSAGEVLSCTACPTLSH